MIILLFLTTSLIQFSSKGWENVLYKALTSILLGLGRKQLVQIQRRRPGMALFPGGRGWRTLLPIGATAAAAAHGRSDNFIHVPGGAGPLSAPSARAPLDFCRVVLLFVLIHFLGPRRLGRVRRRGSLGRVQGGSGWGTHRRRRGGHLMGHQRGCGCLDNKLAGFDWCPALARLFAGGGRKQLTRRRVQQARLSDRARPGDFRCPSVAGTQRAGGNLGREHRIRPLRDHFPSIYIFLCLRLLHFNAQFCLLMA